MSSFEEILHDINSAKMDIVEDKYSEETIILMRGHRDHNDYEYTVYKHIASGKIIKIKEAIYYGCDGKESDFHWAKEAKEIKTVSYEYEELTAQPKGDE